MPSVSALAVDDGVTGHLCMAALRQRCYLVQMVAGKGNHFLTACRIVAVTLPGTLAFGNRVGAIQGIVQAAPAGIGGIQGKARILDRHHQLRARLQGDFPVHIGGGDGNVVYFRQQVTDLFQKRPVGDGVVRSIGPLPVPGVDLFLQGIANGQQFPVARCEFGQNACQ